MLIEKKRCQKQAILFNSFNQIITNTLTGDIMVLFLADILMFKTFKITFILSMIPLIALIRFPLIFLFKECNKIKLIKISIIVKMIFVAILLIFPWDFLSVKRFTALIIFYQIAVEFGVGICWQPLMKKITSDNDRGQFFGKMRFVFMSLNTVFVFLLAVFTKDTISSFQYKLLLYICLIGLSLQFYAISKMGKTLKIFDSNLYYKNKKPIITQFKENKKIIFVLILEIMFLLIGFTLNVVYLKSILGYTSKLVSLYITINNIGGIIALPVLGKILDSNFMKGSSYIAKLYLVYLITFVTLPTYSSGNLLNVLYIIILSLLSGVIASSVYLLMTILQHEAVKTEDSFLVLNLYQIIVFVITFFTTNAFGKIMSYSESERFIIANSFSLDLYKCIYSFLVLCVVIVQGIILRKIANAT